MRQRTFREAIALELEAETPQPGKRMTGEARRALDQAFRNYKHSLKGGEHKNNE